MRMGILFGLVRLRRAALLIALVMVAGQSYVPLSFAAVPFWGAKSSLSADTPPDRLQHGEFIWMGSGSTAGPLVMIVSLDEQRAYVYRNGILIGVTTVSTGRPGHETPTGVFTILQKDQDHRSTIYDSAPMPYMERLTWGGVALHAGGLPGYPESHGCVHLPSEFARLLYQITSTGMVVVIASSATAPTQIAHPGFLAPVAATTGSAEIEQRLQPSETQRWEPQLSSTGPVSIVLSRGSGRVVVYRNGTEIGRSRVIFRGSHPMGTHALILAHGAATAGDRFVPMPGQQHWLRVSIAGHDGEGGEPDPAVAARIEIPDEFVHAVYSVLEIGSTVLVTDEALSPATSGPMLDVVNADPAAAS